MGGLGHEELPCYLLKYPEVLFFLFGALTFPESKRDLFRQQLSSYSGRTVSAASAVFYCAAPTLKL